MTILATEVEGSFRQVFRRKMFGYVELQDLHALPEPGEMFIGHQQLAIAAFYCFEEAIAIAETAITGTDNNYTFGQYLSIENKMLHLAK